MFASHLKPIARRFVLVVPLIAIAAAAANDTRTTSRPNQWGNVTYLNLDVGEMIHHQDHTFTLVSINGRDGIVRVNNTEIELTMARRGLPITIDGLRVFLAATRPVSETTTNRAFPLTHAALTGDAMLAVADANLPLLDPERYTFPIDRSDGFVWSMEEDSHMFAYLTPDRAHEGIDIDLTGAQRTGLHRLLAVENGTIRWVSPGPDPQVCLLIESESQPGLFYIYQHVDRENVFVLAGERVTRGQPLGHIWGDQRWVHLHFTVIASGTQPDYAARYQYVLNAFPSLFELWHGSLTIPPPAPRPQGEFVFADPYSEHGNRQHLGAYTDRFGYGWRLGAGEPTAKVPSSLHVTDPLHGRSALLNHGLHVDNTALPNEDRNSYTFEVAVTQGQYRVHGRVGHGHSPTAQRLLIEDSVAGAWDLKADEWIDAPPLTVRVNDGYLTATIELTNPNQPASLKGLRFERIGD